MKRSSFYLILFIGILVFAAPPTNAKQGTLEYCQKVSDKIRYYTNLRKSGGSAKAMEKWKQQRKKYKVKFTHNNCKKLEDKLKN